MNIFISYRRADAREVARAVQQKLKRTPDVGRVFLDYDAIPKAEDFIKAISGAMRRSRVCIVLIGPQWRGEANPDGTSRINSPNDVVRSEIEQAFKLRRRVIPVLLEATTMPAADSVPDSLHPLLRLNAARLRQESFESDMDHILDTAFGARRVSRWNSPRLTPFRAVRLVFYGLLAVALAAILIGLVNRAVSECDNLTCSIQTAVGLDPNDPQTDMAGLAILLLLLFDAFVLGAVFPFLVRMLKRAFAR